MRRVDRKAVKKFFEWKAPRGIGKLGLALTAVGILALVAFYGIDNDAPDTQLGLQAQAALRMVYAVMGGRAIFLLVAVAFFMGGGYLVFRFLLTRPKMPRKLYGALLDAKQQDLGSVLERSFRRIGVDIDDLLDFDAEDLTDLTLKPTSLESAALLEILQRKTVLLLGPALPYAYGKLVISNKKLIFECSPILVWILYLTRDQLLTYKAIVDITRGDLDEEVVDRIRLMSVVQVGTKTISRRIKEAGDQRLFEQFAAERGRRPEEIVIRQHSITLSMQDSNTKELPLGAQEIEDGDKERLSRSISDEDSRYARVAKQIWMRINDTQ